MNILLLTLLLCLFIATRNTYGQLPDGPCIILHRNGVTYQAWKYPNGRTRCVRTIDQRGIANGVEYRWRQDGSMSFILSNINGQTVFLVQLDEGGKCRAIKTRQNGQPEGPDISFYPSGLVKCYEPSHPREAESNTSTALTSQPARNQPVLETDPDPPQIVVVDGNAFLSTQISSVK